MVNSTVNAARRWGCRLPQPLAALRMIVLLGLTLIQWNAPPASAQQYPSTEVPQTNLVPIGPPPASTVPEGGFGQFDPYALNPNSGLSAGAAPGVTAIGPPTALAPSGIAPSPPGAGLFGRLFSQPASTAVPPGYGSPLQGPSAAPYGYANGGYDAPSIYGPSSGYPATPDFAPAPGTVYPGTVYPGNGYPSTAFPSATPNSLFPGGLFAGGTFGNDPSVQYNAFRLFQGPRLRHGFVGAGDGPDDLQTNDTDASLVFAFPNFLYSTQPLYVVPSFSLHLWDGPQATIGADLPGSAYSAFLDVGWNSDPNQIFATELGLRVGAFTDFDTFNSDSIRVLGKGLLSFRLTPTSTLKGGVYYLDRAEFNLLPAGGILWQPNPYTRVDLFFPEPKYARYWRTLGTQDVWWYLTADSGGGAWTIQRDSGVTDSVDIFDIRAVAGLEWGLSDAIRAGRRTGFLEVGYVFDRQIEYKSARNREIPLDDGIMIRAGIGY